MKIKLSTIIRLCALILVVLFFIPTSIVSCSSYGIKASVDISPFGLATGNLKMESNSPEDTEEYAEDLDNIDAQPVLFAMLALSVILLLLGSKLPILGALSSVANAVVLYIMHTKIAEYIAREYEGMGVGLTKTNVYYIYMVISVGVAILLVSRQFGLMDRVSKTVKAIPVSSGGSRYESNIGTVQKDVPATARDDNDDSTASTKGKKVCGNCGCVCEEDGMFCSNCGSKLKSAADTSDSVTVLDSNVDSTPVPNSESTSKQKVAFHVPDADDLNE